VASRRTSPVDRLAGIGLDRPDSDELTVRGDNHLHSDTDAICPRCLQWVEERDFVRRTAFGLLQHEVCPRPREETA
jgi:hypothetical protein